MEEEDACYQSLFPRATYLPATEAPHSLFLWEEVCEDESRQSLYGTSLRKGSQ